MTSLHLKAAIIAGLIVGTGCVGTQLDPWSHTPDPVPGLPDRLTPDSSFTLTATSDTTCLVHLIDLRTQTRLILERSHVRDSTVRSAIGDYKVEPEGRYGIDEDHLLRILCTTGKPLGKVPE